MKFHWIALSLLTAVTAAQADVQVKFVNPEKFSDIKDNNGFRQSDTVLKDLEGYLVSQTEKRLPGRTVHYEVTDVDLAGQVEPVGRRGEWLRVMRSITSPAITMNYEIKEGDKVVKQGQAKLRDMNYQDSGGMSISSSDPLRYEKRMIERWMQQEFSPTVAAAPAN